MAIVLEGKKAFNVDQALKEVSQLEIREFLIPYLGGNHEARYDFDSNWKEDFRKYDFNQPFALYYTPGEGFSTKGQPFKSIARAEVNLNRVRRREVLRAIAELFEYKWRDDWYQNINNYGEALDIIHDYVVEKFKPAMKKAVKDYMSNVLSETVPDDFMYQIQDFDRHRSFQKTLNELFNWQVNRMKEDLYFNQTIVSYIQDYTDRAIDEIVEHDAIHSIYVVINNADPSDYTVTDFTRDLIQRGHGDALLDEIEEEHKVYGRNESKKFSDIYGIELLDETHRRLLLEETQRKFRKVDRDQFSWYSGLLSALNQEKALIVSRYLLTKERLSPDNFIRYGLESASRAVDVLVLDVEPEVAYRLIATVMRGYEGRIMNKIDKNEKLFFTQRFSDIFSDLTNRLIGITKVYGDNEEYKNNAYQLVEFIASRVYDLDNLPKGSLLIHNDKDK